MTVTAIEPQKRRPNRRSVFVDGLFAFGLHEEELARLKLTPGMEITRKQLDELLSNVVFVNARDTALRYLGARARTYGETVKRLEQDEYPPEVITRVMALMVKYHYIDDKQYAQDYAASRMKNGRMGPFRVKRELKMKAVDEELIDEALRLAGESCGEASGALDWLKRKRLNADELDPAQKKRLTGALLRRGFSYSAVKEAFEMYEGEWID